MNKPSAQSSKSQSLAAIVASRLIADLPTFAGPRLPSLRNLAARYGVCVPVMSEVLHLLAGKNIIEVHARKRAMLVGRSRITEPQSISASDRLYIDIKEQITSGDFGAGTCLPKVAFYVGNRHIANRTVLAVYRRLVAEGIVYRRGKMFFVGRPPDHEQRVSVLYRPVLVILTSRKGAWTSLCRSTRTEQFGQSFIRQAETCQVRLIESHVEKMQAVSPDADSVARKIGDLGENYLGTLVAANRSEISEVESWAARLLRFRKPVVWFDKNDDGLLKPLHSPLFTRCHYCEENTARAAVEYLVACGHRCAAYVMSERATWQEPRLSALEQAAAKSSSGMRILNYTMLSKEEWLDPGHSRVEAELHWLSQNANPSIAAAIDFFVAKRTMLLGRYHRYHTAAWDRSPYAGFAAVTRMRQSEASSTDTALQHMTGVVWAALALVPGLNAGATVIISPSDFIARSFHQHWIQELRLKVPRDISLISFDNTYRDSFYPLTSVDIGFDFLGYQAFHAIMGDVPVARGRKGNIAARARTIDKGSVSVMRSPGIP